MKAEQVDEALRKKFLKEEQRLVFWDDPNGEFIDYISRGLPSELTDVKVLKLAENGALSTKLLLERQDVSGKYLLYSSKEAPASEKDWLLDIRLYSATFHADVASIWRQDLGLSSVNLRGHLKARAGFLSVQKNFNSLKVMCTSDDDEDSLDHKMLAVLVGSKLANIFSILQALCQGHTNKGRFDLEEAPELLGTFEEMGLSQSFWRFVKAKFDYDNDKPSIASLLRHLLVSELIQQSSQKIDSLANFKLSRLGRQNAGICLTQWRDSSNTAESYDAVAKAISKELNLKLAISDLPFESRTQIFTVWEAELLVTSGLKEKALNSIQSIDVDEFSALTTERRAGHWLSGPGRDLPERIAVADAYDAIVAAAELFALRIKHQSFSFDSPQALLTAYQKELYRFDMFYRRFCTKAQSAQGQGWDLLKTLATEVERVYDQSFLQPLGIEWSKLLDDGFLETWKLPDFPNQQNFYADKIVPQLKDPKKRAFVIISDAFRYEAAHELLEEMTGSYRQKSELSAMLGVLPSYTTLGMASLLPHKTLDYKGKGDVFVDGKSVSGTPARDKQLGTVDGMACLAKDLVVMKQKEARDFTRGKRVIYIYHNVIDARGDTASTESETFAAVSDCIRELKDLVRFCINTLNAGKVWVTADHGFLFQQEAPDVTDKNELSKKPSKPVKKKKRFIIGEKLGATSEAHTGSTAVTAGTDKSMEFWLPRGATRFHFVGGARFVHGGAMPQEVVVPVLTVKVLHGDKKAKSRSEKVSIQILTTKHRITTPRYRFEFIQTEAVGDTRKPITVRAAIYDGPVAVTSIDTVTFDSSSQNIEDRKKSIRLELGSGEFDKSKPYRLILRDADTEAQVGSFQVVIDRSFEDDF